MGVHLSHSLRERKAATGRRIGRDRQSRKKKQIDGKVVQASEPKGGTQEVPESMLSDEGGKVRTRQQKKRPVRGGGKEKSRRRGKGIKGNRLKKKSHKKNEKGWGGHRV